MKNILSIRYYAYILFICTVLFTSGFLLIYVAKVSLKNYITSIETYLWVLGRTVLDSLSTNSINTKSISTILCSLKGHINMNNS